MFELPITQAHVADTAGLTSVHVNRTLKGLAKLGTRFHHETVRIDHWDALVKIRDFDPAYLEDDLRPGMGLRIPRACARGNCKKGGRRTRRIDHPGNRVIAAD